VLSVGAWSTGGLRSSAIRLPWSCILRLSINSRLTRNDARQA
jgi:hypothetical protein